MLKITRRRLYVVPVLLRSLDILEFLSRIGVPQKMNEISSGTGVSLTTTYRILRTLVYRGYLDHNLEGKYSLASLPDVKTAFLRHAHAPEAGASAA